MSIAANIAQKSIGQVTRGKTARNRLRRVDIFLSMYATELIRKQNPQNQPSWLVDLGYGAEPYTVLESATHLRKINPNLPILGVEIEPERVASGLPYQDEHTQFRLGGFNVPLQSNESIRLIRAFNVLRQYDEHQVLAAWQSMAMHMETNGLIIEGTSDPFGKRWVANLLRVRRQANGERVLIQEGLLFSTNFHDGFTPDMFQPVLPKNLIHHMLPQNEIYQFFEKWKIATEQQSALQSYGLRQWFAASALAQSRMGYPILTRKKMLRQGFLFWQMQRPICSLAQDAPALFLEKKLSSILSTI
ncbi:MAG: hypothetical protein JEZ00_17960 [Anaerolineaceae bacterium]|nr:hypothetical protein [Anaerolineaceae bacterium]